MRWFKRLFYTLSSYEQSPERFALSFCIGNYIAFSPFIGLHTVMIFIFSWLLRLNFAVTFAVAYAVNNIWTAVPVYMAGYVFGYWLLHSVINVNTAYFTPAWAEWISLLCEKQLGLPKPCFWSFMLGGNILGILLSLILYPIIKNLFMYQISAEQSHKNIQIHENSGQ